ncbi:MAG: hypothetical protein GY820_21965 [Gammaproteobacteria bacterium]|nr:hypothetical protein [Gammaproteobacteria bacterium]
MGKNVTLAKCPPLASPRVAIFETGVGKGHPKGGPCRSMTVKSENVYLPYFLRWHFGATMRRIVPPVPLWSRAPKF